VSENMPNLVNRRRRKSKVIESSNSAVKSDSTDSDGYEFSSKLNFNYHHQSHHHVMEKAKTFRGGDEKISQQQHQKLLEAHKIRYE
jgi:hypothetical protein